jgi:hypothetical protein
VAARVRARIRSQAENLRRLAVVFAVELRLKIVTELYQRPMSPKEFHEEFDGGTISRVNQNFEQLQKHDWLRETAKVGPGGKRRGGTEHFFRATELAFFDQATWAVLPYSIRVAFSWNIFGSIAAQLRAAIERNAFKAGGGTGLKVETLLFDQIGWKRVIDVFSQKFEALYEEQDDARMRACRTQEKLIRANVVQLAFESPAGGSKGSTSGLFVADEELLIPLLVRASRVFGDALCLEIIEAANERMISATEFHAEFGGDQGSIRRRFRKATENGWLKEVEWKTGGKRRGATEKFYRATIPSVAKADLLLAGIEESVKGTNDWRSFERLHARFVEAMGAGTVDSRVDRCLAWSMLQLDALGWTKVAESVRELWELLLAEQESARIRMAETGEDPIAVTFALASFESSPDPERQP